MPGASLDGIFYFEVVFLGVVLFVFSGGCTGGFIGRKPSFFSSTISFFFNGFCLFSISRILAPLLSCYGFNLFEAHSEICELDSFLV